MFEIKKTTQTDQISREMENHNNKPHHPRKSGSKTDKKKKKAGITDGERAKNPKVITF